MEKLKLGILHAYIRVLLALLKKESPQGHYTEITGQTLEKCSFPVMSQASSKKLIKGVKAMKYDGEKWNEYRKLQAQDFIRNASAAEKEEILLRGTLRRIDERFNTEASKVELEKNGYPILAPTELVTGTRIDYGTLVEKVINVMLTNPRHAKAGKKALAKKTASALAEFLESVK